MITSETSNDSGECGAPSDGDGGVSPREALADPRSVEQATLATPRAAAGPAVAGGSADAPGVEPPPALLINRPCLACRYELVAHPAGRPCPECGVPVEEYGPGFDDAYVRWFVRIALGQVWLLLTPIVLLSAAAATAIQHEMRRGLYLDVGELWIVSALVWAVGTGLLWRWMRSWHGPYVLAVCMMIGDACRRPHRLRSTLGRWRWTFHRSVLPVVAVGGLGPLISFGIHRGREVARFQSAPEYVDAVIMVSGAVLALVPMLVGLFSFASSCPTLECDEAAATGEGRAHPRIDDPLPTRSTRTGRLVRRLQSAVGRSPVEVERSSTKVLRYVGIVLVGVVIAWCVHEIVRAATMVSGFGVSLPLPWLQGGLDVRMDALLMIALCVTMVLIGALTCWRVMVLSLWISGRAEAPPHWFSPGLGGAAAAGAVFLCIAMPSAIVVGIAVLLLAGVWMGMLLQLDWAFAKAMGHLEEAGHSETTGTQGPPAAASIEDEPIGSERERESTA